MSKRAAQPKEESNQRFQLDTDTLNDMLFAVVAAENGGLKYSEDDECVGAIRDLLKAGAQIDATDDNDMGLIHYVARTQKTLTLDALVGLGARIDETDSDGNTPLILAVMCFSNEDEEYDMIKQILHHKPNINLTNSLGNSALNLASRHGKHGVVELLLEHEADPTMRDIQMCINNGDSIDHLKTLRELVNALINERE